MTGGGIVHGPTPRNYAQRTPKKMIAAALLGALSDRARGARVHVVESLRRATRRRRRSLSSCSPTIAPSKHVLVVLERDDELSLQERPQPPDRSRAAVRPAQRLRRARQRRHRLHQERLRGVRRLRRPQQGRGHRMSAHTYKDPRDVIIAPVVSEKSYGLIDRGQVHLHRRPPLEQDRDQARHREDLRRQGRHRSTRSTASGKTRRTKFGTRQAQRHQARHRHAQVRLHRHLHGCRLGSRGITTWLFASTSPRPRVAAVPRSPTSPRSRARRPRSRCCVRCSKTGGRNNAGRITTRHIGGGHKRQYRVIDFRRNDKDGVNAKVAHIEYDPNRTARIALLHFVDGTKRYIIAPNKLNAGRHRRVGSRRPTSSPATTCR